MWNTCQLYLYIGVGNIIPTIGEMCQLEGFCPPGNVHFVMYIFVLDICCQHLGNIRQLKGFCAPFGRKVKECTLCNIYIYIYICIGYMLPTFGEHMSVEFIHCSRAELSGAQLSTFSGRTIGPRGPTVRGPTVWGPIRLEPLVIPPPSPPHKIFSFKKWGKW